MARIFNADEFFKSFPELDIEPYNNFPTAVPFEPDYVGAERLKARQRGYEDGYRNGMEIGKKLNPQIKRGEWEEIEGCFRDRRCSNCKRQTPCEEQGKFCINCGADMRKEADNDIHN